MFNSAIALVTFSLLARALTKEDFGHWAFFLAVYGLLEMALSGLVRTPMIRMAANTEDYSYNEVLASAWDIVIKTAVPIGVFVGLGFFIASWETGDEVYFHFAYWFPLYFFLTLPQLIGMWNANALMRFQRVLVIRATSVSLFLAGVLYVYLTEGDLELIFWFYLIATAGSSALVLGFGWASIKCYFRYKKTYRKEILNFGKYSMGTTISSSLLVNSDSFIIMYFLGPTALALYEIPKRISGLYDIPLRSVLQLSYPHLSKRVGRADNADFRTEFERILGFTFLMLLPLGIIIFVFAEYFVTLLGGADYSSSGNILRVFAIFLMLSPLDRFSGLVLDVLNRPNVNFNKVLVMLLVNVIGDFLAIHLGFGLVGVASVTTATVTAGIVYGFYMHRGAVPFRPAKLVKEGITQARIFIKTKR